MIIDHGLLLTAGEGADCDKRKIYGLIHKRVDRRVQPGNLTVAPLPVQWRVHILSSGAGWHTEFALTNSKHMLQATQDVVSRVPQTTSAEFEAAVAAARDAFPAWRRTPVSVRQRVMLRLQHLIRENTVCTAHRRT